MSERKNNFIVHYVERRDSRTWKSADGKIGDDRWRISYEVRGEWKPRTVYLDDLLDELSNKSTENERV